MQPIRFGGSIYGVRPFIGMLTALVALAVLAGCGSGGSDDADRGIEGARVRVVSGTGVHLVQSGFATALPDQAAIDSFLDPVRSGSAPDGRFADQVRTAIDRLDVGSDEMLYAEVVHTGCARARADSVTVERSDGDIVMSSDFAEPKDAECYAPVLTLALAALPDVSSGGVPASSAGPEG